MSVDLRQLADQLGLPLDERDIETIAADAGLAVNRDRRGRPTLSDGDAAILVRSIKARGFAVRGPSRS